MTPDEKQFLFTVAWMFARHGCSARARNVLEAAVEDDPRDGRAAAAFAGMLLADGEPARALETLRAADYPPDLAHAQAVLETRALRALGRKDEAAARWRRWIESAKGASRRWVDEGAAAK